MIQNNTPSILLSFKYRLEHNTLISLLFFILLLNITLTPLQAGTRITGIITNEEGSPISDVNIKLHPTSYGTTSDSDGFFYLPRVANGNYTIKLNHIAYEQQEFDVKSYTTDKIKLKIKLHPIEYDLAPLVFTTEKIRSANKVVIDRRTIESANYSSAEEILANAGSIQISKTGNTTSKMSIRGSNSNQVSVMLDGITVNSRMDGSFDLNSIPAEAIERIDIYKGGDIELSSQAIGGIINIITKKDYILEDASASAKYSNKGYFSDRDNLKLSSFNNPGYSFTTNFQTGINKVFFTCTTQNHANQWSYINAAKADRYRYDENNPNGYIENSPRKHDNSYYKTINLLTTINGKYQNFGYNLLSNYTADSYGLPGWYDVPYHKANTNGENFKNRLNLKYEPDQLKEFSLDLYNDKNSKSVLIEEISPLYYTDSKDNYNNRGIKSKFNYTGSSLTFKTGAEYTYESVKSENIEGKEIRETSSGFITLDSKFWENDKKTFYLKAFGGARGDYISTQENIEDFYSGGLLSEMKISAFTFLPKIKFEQNYRLPTFSDLFWIDNMTSSGNPTLKPEYSETGEASLTISYSTIPVEITSSFEIYEKKMSNLIVWEKQSSGKYIPVNRRGGNIRGTATEFNLSLLDNMLNLKGIYSTLDTKSYTYKLGTDNKEIIYKPQNTFNGNIDFNYKKASVAFSSYYNGKMFLNERNTISIDPFWLFGTRISYEHNLNDKIKIKTFLNIENLADEQYQVVYGYPMPGRSVELGLKVNL